MACGRGGGGGKSSARQLLCGDDRCDADMQSRQETGRSGGGDREVKGRRGGAGEG